MEKPQTRGIFYFLLLIVLVLAGVHFWPIYKNRNQPLPPPVNTPTDQKTTEDPALLVNPEHYETITVSEESSYAIVDISFPRFKLLSTLENDKIENLYRTFIKEHNQIARDNFTARLDTMTAEEKIAYSTGLKKEEKYAAYGDFTVIQANKDYISVLFVYGGYQGGAHGFEAVSSFNYDLKNEKRVTLAALFPQEKDILGFISEQSRMKLLAKLTPAITYEKNFKDIYTEPSLEILFPDDIPPKEVEPLVNQQIDPPKNTYSEQDINLAQMIYEGTNPLAENFKVFTFTPTDITLYFGEYQVAPYVYGRQEVTQPLPQVSAPVTLIAP